MYLNGLKYTPWEEWGPEKQKLLLSSVQQEEEMRSHRPGVELHKHLRVCIGFCPTYVEEGNGEDKGEKG